MDSDVKIDSSKKEAFSAVLLAFMDYKGLSQRKFAEKIDSKPANFNKRVAAGSMRADMILKINETFGIDLLSMVNRVLAGESVDSVVKNAQAKQKENIEFELSAEEVKEVIMNQTKSHEELMAEFHALVGQMRTWLEHDRQKSLRQEELINLLMEERAEYKAKKK